jgi:23S rRNA pseudouridine1911/1915/1917 synthase
MISASSSPASSTSSEGGELVVTEELEGSRLDKAISALRPELSRAKVKRVLEAKAVRVNGRVLPKGALVAKGDVIRFDAGAELEGEACVAEADAPLTVLYESASVVIVSKPSGQPTAPIRPGEKGSLANALLGRYPELSGIGHSPREPGLVHRIDTETTGAVLVARTAAAFDTLKAALKEGKLDKSYLLICSEEGLPDSGTIEYPIANHPKDQRRVYPCIHPRDVVRYEPRPAVTRYEVRERKAPWALVEVSVSKALRHQIRAHFAAIEHPLAGDTLYGGAEVRALGRHALHASRIAFKGGAGVEAFDVRAELPADMAALLG